MSDMDICFITDNGYCTLTRGAVNSVIANSGKEHVNIHIICVDVSEENKSKFLAKSTDNVQIHIIEKNNFNPRCELKHITKHVTKSALLKFQLADIFSHLDKILYLDGDMVATGSLKELFQQNIADVYAAVVADTIAVLRMNAPARLGNKNYFNSGMMLLNLKKIRKDNLVPKLIKAKENDKWNLFMDQDALNEVFGDKVKYIHPKYNFMYLNNKIFPQEKVATFYKMTESELLETMDNSLIYHLTGKYKPTKYLTKGKNYYWWLYADKLDFILNLKELFFSQEHLLNSVSQPKQPENKPRKIKKIFFLFNLLPFVKYRKTERNIKISVLEIPLLKIKRKKSCSKIYLFSFIPLFKIYARQ